MIGLALVPIAYTIRSVSKSNSLPATGTGRRRPESSGSPSSMRTQRMPRTLPCPSSNTATGLVSQWNSTPSCSA